MRLYSSFEMIKCFILRKLFQKMDKNLTFHVGLLAMLITLKATEKNRKGVYIQKTLKQHFFLLKDITISKLANLVIGSNEWRFLI